MNADRWNNVGNLESYLPFAHDPALLAALDVETAVRFMRYFYACPTVPGRTLRLRSRVLALYDPFALRSVFPAGRRLCCNVYTGCAHACRYCYISGYIRDPKQARNKSKFRVQLDRDLHDLKALVLPPLPVHISNSTDPLQEAMEGQFEDTLHLLSRLVEHHHLFSAVTMLTKNPARLLGRQYLELVHALGGKFSVQVSLAFWDDERRRLFEPGSPSVSDRKEAISGLCASGVRVALRLDPLFPFNPLPREFFQKPAVEDYGAWTAHSRAHIRNLVTFAAEAKCERIIASPLKVPCGRYRDAGFLDQFQPLYVAAKGGSVKSFTLRLPEEYARNHLTAFVKQLGAERDLTVQHCMHNLISNPTRASLIPQHQPSQTPSC